MVDVHHDLQIMEFLGLTMNRLKSELIWSDATMRDAFLSLVSELQVVRCSQAILLGTPIGSAEQVYISISAKVLTLLRHSF